MGMMSEFDIRLRELVRVLHIVLDDDLPDAMDDVALTLANEFDIDDVEWVWEQVEYRYCQGSEGY